MKFAIFLQHYFPYGGLQRDALRLAEAGLESGDEPTLVVSTWDGPKPSAVPVRELQSGGTSNHAKMARFAEDCQTTFEDYDTSIGFHRVPGAPFHFCGDACILERFQATKPPIAKWLPRYRYQLETERAVFGQNSATHVFFLAQPEIDVYQKHYSLDAKRCTLLPPWLRQPDPLEARSVLRPRMLTELGLKESDQLLLFVGSNFRLKRLETLIEALPLLKPHVHLLVCGDDKATELRKRATTLGVEGRVHWLGASDALPTWMTVADLLVHPSERETAGMVLTEALTYGLPVTCTESCGYAPYVAEAGGTVLRAQCSPGELADTAKVMLSNTTVLRRLAHDWATKPHRHGTARILLDRLRQS